MTEFRFPDCGSRIWESEIPPRRAEHKHSEFRSLPRDSNHSAIRNPKFSTAFLSGLCVRFPCLRLALCYTAPSLKRDRSRQTRVRNPKRVHVMDCIRSNLQTDLIDQSCNRPRFSRPKGAVFQKPTIVEFDL
jgi:hypothetical protein